MRKLRTPWTWNISWARYYLLNDGTQGPASLDEHHSNKPLSQSQSTQQIGHGLVHQWAMPTSSPVKWKKEKKTNQKLSFLEAHMWHPCWKKAQLQPVCRDLSPSIKTIMQWEKTYKPPIHQTYIHWLLIIKSAENHLLHTRFWKIYMSIHSFQISHIPFCCRSMKHCPYNIKSR